jgi:hypothetical protein
LLQRNVLHSFAPWAQFRQPEKQELRYSGNGKRKNLAKNCALSANPKCPWNYTGLEVGSTLDRFPLDRSVSYAPPAYYAHHACARGRAWMLRQDATLDTASASSGGSGGSAGWTWGFAEPHPDIKDTMFFI